jgi:branched-chain amino acid transport system permease protein
MSRFIVALVGGFSLGGTYALIGLGLVMAFRATETFNFAHGQLMLLPAFTMGYIQLQYHLPFFVELFISLAIAAVVGMLMYLVVLQRTVGMPVFMGLVATLGIAAILDAVMVLKFGSNQYTITIPGMPDGVVTIFGARISKESLVLTAFTLVLAALIAGIMRFTPVGHRIYAAGQDAVLASQGGIHVRRIYLGSWALAAVLAGIAGITYGASAVVTPSMTELGLAAIPAIMFGGLDSIEGSVVGGLAVGILQGFTATYLGGEYLDVVTYSLLLVVLLIQPAGLFGTKRVTRV